MGGGQIKDAETLWSIDSLQAAAAAFPLRVAQQPQRTWAILTKYKANRDFIKAYSNLSLSTTLQYDQISTITAELFDNFMEYKLLLKRIQSVLKSRDTYQSKLVVNAISTDLATLLSVKSAIQNEQTKIVEAIDTLGRDPGILKRQNSHFRRADSPVVAKILDAAIGSRKPQANTPSSGTSASGSETSGVVVVSTTAAASTQDNKTSAPFLDLESLVSPEIWGDLLPEPKAGFANDPVANAP